MVHDDDREAMLGGKPLELRHRIVVELLAGARAAESLERVDDPLLADLILPGMNGVQLAEEVKARQPEARVLFMTGYSRDAILHQWPVDASIETLHKPLTQDVLEQKVCAVLNQVR